MVNNWKDEHTLRLFVADYSPVPITNVKLRVAGSGDSGPNAEFTNFEFNPGDCPNPVIYQCIPWRTGVRTPASTPQLTVEVSWKRPMHGDAFRRGDGDAVVDGVTLHATARIPDYRGTANKAFAIVFLLKDQVRVETVDLVRFSGKVDRPADDGYVAQGRETQRIPQAEPNRYQIATQKHWPEYKRKRGSLERIGRFDLQRAREVLY